MVDGLGVFGNRDGKIGIYFTLDILDWGWWLFIFNFDCLNMVHFVKDGLLFVMDVNDNIDLTHDRLRRHFGSLLPQLIQLPVVLTSGYKHSCISIACFIFSLHFILPHTSLLFLHHSSSSSPPPPSTSANFVSFNWFFLSLLLYMTGLFINGRLFFNFAIWPCIFEYIPSNCAGCCSSEWSSSCLWDFFLFLVWPRISSNTWTFWLFCFNFS